MKNTTYLAIIIFSLFSCSKKEENTEKTTILSPNSLQLSPLQIKNAGIETSTFTNENTSKIIELMGTTEVAPESLAQISSPIPGIVKCRSCWIEGMPIRKGEVLAYLYDPSIVQLQQDYLLAVSNENLAKSDFNRQKNLNEDLSTSKKNLQQSQNNFENQTITKYALAEKLRMIGIRPEKLTTRNLKTNISILAPFSGVISKANVKTGQFVNPSEMLYEIQNNQGLHLNLQVFEKDLLSVFEGQKVRAYSTQNSEKFYTAKVHYISKNFDEQRRVSVHCDFDNSTSDLYSGMMMKAIAEGKESNSLTLPEDAVVSFENQTYVFVALPKNQYQMKPVKVGENQNKRISISEVSSELLQSKIVVKGAYQLLMALKNIEE